MHTTLELYRICGTMFSGICIDALSGAGGSSVCAVVD